MADLDLDAIEARYSAALDARPSKGVQIGDRAWTALTDSVADIPELVAEVAEIRAREERVRALHDRIWTNLRVMGQSAWAGWMCDACRVEYPCPTVRALDHAEVEVAG